MLSLDKSTNLKGGDVVFSATFIAKSGSSIDLTNALIVFTAKREDGTSFITLSTPSTLSKITNTATTQTVRGVIPASASADLPKGVVTIKYGFTITTANNIFREAGYMGSFNYKDFL